MSEASAIEATRSPVTVATLRRDLRALGLGPGAVVIVHSSLRALGWVAGGAQAVVQALLETVEPQGTVVVPTQSVHLSDPARWEAPPVPAHWVPLLRDGLPAYDPHLTPTRGMGAIVECFRSDPATLRSTHPILSFAANGAEAAALVGVHPLTPALGEGSPLARLYDRDALVLLLGVDHDTNTSLHLAEHRATWATKTTYREGVPMLVDGERQWVTYEDLELVTDDFERIGRTFVDAGGVEIAGPVGFGTGRLYRQRDLVDFATRWMTANR